MSKPLNRQCRFPDRSDWHSYGDVGFFAAIRQHCADHSEHLHNRVEVRCDSEPDKVDVFEVVGVIDWQILRPRQGA